MITKDLEQMPSNWEDCSQSDLDLANFILQGGLKK